MKGLLAVLAAFIMAVVPGNAAGEDGIIDGQAAVIWETAEVSDIPAASVSADEREPSVWFEDGGGMFIPGGVEYSLRLEEAAMSTGWCIGVCTGFPLDGGERKYESVFGERDGVILFINKGVAKVVAGGAAAEYVNGERAKNIVRLVDREIRHERNVNIPEVFAGRLEGLRRKGPGSFDLYPPAFLVAVAGAFAAGFGTVFWLGRRYSPGEPPTVNNYLDVRSIEVYRKNDTQLFSKSVRYRNNIIQQMVRGEGVFKRRR